MSADRPETKTFLIWWLRILCCSCASIFGLLFASYLAVGSNPIALVILIPLAACCFAGGIRYLGRGATIRFDSFGVTAPMMIRTRRVPWSDIKSVHVGRGSSATPLPWLVPVFELYSGPPLVAQEFRSLRNGGIVDDVVAHATDAIEMQVANGTPTQPS